MYTDINFLNKNNKIFSLLKTYLYLKKNTKNIDRKLEIGPGEKRIPSFETLNIVNNKLTDYVIDSSKQLPFPNNTFTIIYASHVFEHTPWYFNSKILKEWVRILKPKGKIEIWVPDVYKICKAFVNCEDKKTNKYIKENWFKFNEEKDPCVWVNSRIFSYGDGTENLNHPNWHFSVFSYRYLKKLFLCCGLKKIQKLNYSNVRGYNHGWINLGISGEK